MLKANIKVAMLAALALILPFAAGIVHAAETGKPAIAKPPALNKPPELTKPMSDATSGKKKATETPDEQIVPAPTIDTNNDGKPDSWDRDGNGLVDAWDTNNDNKPDLFDENGDGKPDDAKAPSANPEGEGEIRN
jgi:hypothetical protein